MAAKDATADLSALAEKPVEIIHYEGRPVLARRATLLRSGIGPFVKESIKLVMELMEKVFRSH